MKKQFNLIISKNPYELDTMISCTDSLAALTEKNSNFIEAVVRLDSNYRKEASITEPESGFNPITMCNASKGKYHGSSPYWFSKMERANSDKDFKRAVLGAVIAIDTTNSTHLLAAVGARKVMQERICKACQCQINMLKELLNKPFDPEDSEHLINQLLAPVPGVRKQKNGSVTFRYNISFASKFCSYASSYFHTHFEYPKYDSVVSDWLGKYLLAYTGEKPKGSFKMPSGKRTKEKKEKIESETYQRYWNAISQILNRVNGNKNLLTYERFDHIVWYANKG